MKSKNDTEIEDLSNMQDIVWMSLGSLYSLQTQKDLESVSLARRGYESSLGQSKEEFRLLSAGLLNCHFKCPFALQGVRIGWKWAFIYWQFLNADSGILSCKVFVSFAFSEELSPHRCSQCRHLLSWLALQWTKKKKENPWASGKVLSLMSTERGCWGPLSLTCSSDKYLLGEWICLIAFRSVFV